MMHLDAHAFQFLASIPAVTLITQYAKQFVSNRHRALIPLAVGIGIATLTHNLGVDHQEATTLVQTLMGVAAEGVGLGAVASTFRDYTVDNKDVIDKAGSAVKELINGGER